MIYLSTEGRRRISACNVNYSPEGILHPDRIMGDYDLLYLQNGTWDIYEGNAQYHLEPQQLLLLEPGLHHYSLERCTPHMRNMYIHFSPLPEDGYPSPSSLRLQKITPLSSVPAIHPLFEQIIDTYWSDRPHSALRLRSLLELLLLELALPDQEALPQTDSVVLQILHLFHTCSSRFFTPEELARDAGISVRNLSTRFKTSTGFSIHQYQIRLKLNMAYDLLPQNPGRGLRDIALSFGFYDEFQFSKLFKRQFGYSPSALKTGICREK